MENVEESGSKRRRVGLACQACRTRKSRCDGQRPTCSACKELDFDCVYKRSTVSANAIVGKDYLSSLEERLESVEQRLNRVEDKNGRTHESQTQSSPGSAQHTIESSEKEATWSATGAVVVDETDQDGNTAGDSTDGMGAMVFTDEENSGFFGPSSNIAFTRHITRAFARLSNLEHNLSTPRLHEDFQLDGGFMNVSRAASVSPKLNQVSLHNGPLPGQKLNLFALPSVEETQNLIRRYFSNTGSLFPFIHEESFLECYEEMRRTGFTKTRKTWLALLNMVLAFATSTKIEPRVSAVKRTQLSDVFYKRAIGLLKTNIWHGTSVEYVQYLLLVGQYLQGTQKSIQTWNVHGLAVKTAFQLGLHSTEASRRFPPLEQEIRKRVWFGCVILDRTMSMTFGRPATIPETYVRLTLAEDFTTIGPGPSPIDPQKHNSTQFYNATITLYQVLWSIIELLYGANLGCDSSDSALDVISRIFKLEQELSEWEHKLPPNMGLIQSQAIPPDANACGIERYRVILTLRYLNLRILIHRLVVVRYLDICGSAKANVSELALLKQILSNSVQICVSSSLEIIAIVGTTGSQLLGAWWFSLYYTFNAALVIFACVLVSENDKLASSSIVLPEILSQLDKPLQPAIDALKLLDFENRMVAKCSTFLERLNAVLYALVSGNLGPSNQENIMQDNMPPVVYNNSMGEMGLGDLDYQSPSGIDLGEFMIDGSLDFFSFEQQSYRAEL